MAATLRAGAGSTGPAVADEALEEERAWAAALLEQERAAMSMALAAVAVLFPAYAALDWWVEPGLAPGFRWPRAVVTVIAALSWLRLRGPPDLWLHRALTALTWLSAALVVAFFLSRVEHHTQYAIGFSLLFWGAGLLALWTWRLTALCFSVALLAYGASVATNPHVDLATTFGVGAYVFSAALLAVAATFVRRELERRSFLSSRSQARANRALAEALESVRVSEEQLRQAHESLKVETTSRQQMEVELRQAQKLEAVGRLASGIAHEINTPVQFVSDSVHFLKDGLGDLAGLVERYHAVLDAAADGPHAPLVQAARDAEAEADLDYLLERMPQAATRALEGLGRVAVIVKSMKEFAHPGAKEKSPVDLNRAIQSTLVIARNEYKYVAELVTSYGELPPVECLVADVNQVVLNLVVNAAHAIGDVVKGTDRKGTIRVETRQEGDFVQVSVSDTGTGIPTDVQQRVFDPFFTTKELGRGTGQGLAIARSVVVDKHQGELTFETTPGQGTTFHVRLPISARHAPAPLERRAA